MIKIQDLHPEYVTDERGNRKSVILPFSDFQELIEDIEDLAAIAERRNEPTVSHEEILKELNKPRDQSPG
ncbi:hypothetical protein QUF72_18115 [Desulfobacterales bacterium HSG2]|nr:hypothetical protein [Desulfobacterales bacterium HSG2]